MLFLRWVIYYNWVFTFSTQSQLCRKNIPLKWGWVYLRILKPARMPQNLLLLSNSARNISARIKWDSLKFQNYFSNQSMFWKAHIYTLNFFSYSWKVLFAKWKDLELCGDYVSRLQLYLIHLFKTSIIESRPYRWPGEWGCSRQSIWVTEDLGSLGRANGDQGGPG